VTDRTTVRTVVVFLGMAGLLLVAGIVWLFREVLSASQGREQLDPSVVAMFGTVATLAGTVTGALGAMLVSTRSSGAGAAAPMEPDQVAALIQAQLANGLQQLEPKPPVEVEVVNGPAAPVPTTDTGLAPAGDDAEDFPGPPLVR
jgi:hypothetical protein